MQLREKVASKSLPFLLLDQAARHSASALSQKHWPPLCGITAPQFTLRHPPTGSSIGAAIAGLISYKSKLFSEAHLNSDGASDALVSLPVLEGCDNTVHRMSAFFELPVRFTNSVRLRSGPERGLRHSIQNSEGIAPSLCIVLSDHSPREPSRIERPKLRLRIGALRCNLPAAPTSAQSRS
jgi:hypothetical protein